MDLQTKAVGWPLLNRGGDIAANECARQYVGAATSGQILNRGGTGTPVPHMDPPLTTCLVVCSGR